MIWYGPFHCVRSYYLKAKEPKLSYIDSCCALSPFCHYSLRIVIGPRNVRPYTNSKGANPKHSWGNSRLSKITLGKYLPQSFGLSTHIRFKICLRVTLERSAHPLHIWWHGVVGSCFNNFSLLTSYLSPDVNWLPILVSIPFQVLRILGKGGLFYPLNLTISWYSTFFCVLAFFIESRVHCKRRVCFCLFLSCCLVSIVETAWGFQ